MVKGEEEVEAGKGMERGYRQGKGGRGETEGEGEGGWRGRQTDRQTSARDIGAENNASR